MEKCKEVKNRINNRISKIHQWALRLVYQNNDLSFSKLYTRETCRFLQQKFLK